MPDSAPDTAGPARVGPTYGPARGTSRANTRGRRRAIADSITEDALQLLFAARQDLSEVHDEDDVDGYVAAAERKVLSAIAVLRGVADAVRATVPDAGSAAAPGDTPAFVLDTLSDAWAVTTADNRILYASAGVRELLNASAETFERLAVDARPWVAPHVAEDHLAAARRTGSAVSDMEIVPTDSTPISVRLSTRRLTDIPGTTASYVTVFHRL